MVKFTTAVDVGTIINKATVDGQIYGGLAQGIGLALTEDFEDLKKHTSLDGCGLPYIKDIPDDMEILYQETPRPLGPFGAAGVGEAPLTAPHPAILNAIYNACGVRIFTGSRSAAGREGGPGGQAPVSAGRHGPRARARTRGAVHAGAASRVHRRLPGPRGRARARGPRSAGGLRRRAGDPGPARSLSGHHRPDLRPPLREVLQARGGRRAGPDRRAGAGLRRSAADPRRPASPSRVSTSAWRWWAGG